MALDWNTFDNPLRSRGLFCLEICNFFWLIFGGVVYLIQFVIQLQDLFQRKYFKTKACTRTAAPEALRTPVRHRWLGNTNCHRSAEARPIYIFFALDLLRMQKGRETERKRHPTRRNVATTITITGHYFVLASSQQTWHCVYACVYGECTAYVCMYVWCWSARVC